MHFEAHTIKGMLNNFVEYIMFMSGSGTGIAFQRVQQTIIINMGSHFRTSDIYVPVIKANEHTDTVWINGKQEIPFMLEHDGIMSMYVIGLKPGMLPWLADLPAIETNDLAVGAENWGTREIYTLREQLLGCPDIRAGLVLIEQYLEKLLQKKDFTHLDKIKWLGNAINTHTVDEICRSLGVTRKKLRSEAQYYFGDSLKNIQGIARFNNTLHGIAHHAHQSLSSVHTYYDQSHFINDFKARCGITPLQYKKLCRQYPEIKYTPNFIPLQRETFLQFISGQPV